MKPLHLLAAIGLSVGVVCGSAHAAVTVIGSGPAQLCYQGAENGDDPSLYVGYCNSALAGVLSDRDRAATYVNRGVLRLSLAESNAAFDDFNSGLAIDASLGEGYVDRGASLIAQKQFASAVNDIDKGLSLGAKRPAVAYYDRAICDEALGDVQGAYKDYHQALDAEPSFSLASDELKRFKVVRGSEKI